jgi:cell division control protein 6
LNPFDKYSIHTIPLKGDISILTASHEPDSFPHREEQIEKMVNSMRGIIMGMKTNHLLIYGKTGTGKTSVTKYVTSKLREKLGERLIISYINCQAYDSPYSIMVNIAKNVPGAENIPVSGWPLDRIYDELVSSMTKAGTSLIVILDEIDKLVEKNGGDSLYVILKLIDENPGVLGIVVGITNDTSFYEKLDSRVKSRLSRDSVIFHPYNAEQLKDILLPRVSSILKQEQYEEAAINLCAAIGAQEHGDARKAIDLMRVSIELAMLDSSVMVIRDYVYKAREKLDSDILRDTVKTLPTHAKIVLYSVILSIQVHPNSATTGEVGMFYNKMCNLLGYTPLTSRRISDYINDLEDYGMIGTMLKSLGRYGRTRIIRTSGREDDIKRFILEDSDLEKLRDVNLSTQLKFEQ